MIINEASAGTLESGDILVRLSASETEGIAIELDSNVAYQFGDQIKKVITDTLHECGITSAHVSATDKGALDCTIRARVMAVAERATGEAAPL